MELYEKKLIKKNLKKLTISQLCEVAGEDVVDMLDARGTAITNSVVIDIIIETKGFSLFNDKVILNHFCDLAEVKKIRSWSNNNACIELLDAYGLSHNFLKESQRRRELSIESIPEFILHNYQDNLKKRTSEFLLGEKKKLMIQLQR